MRTKLDTKTFYVQILGSSCNEDQELYLNFKDPVIPDPEQGPPYFKHIKRKFVMDDTEITLIFKDPSKFYHNRGAVNPPRIYTDDDLYLITIDMSNEADLSLLRGLHTQIMRYTSKGEIFVAVRNLMNQNSQHIIRYEKLLDFCEISNIDVICIKTSMKYYAASLFLEKCALLLAYKDDPWSFDHQLTLRQTQYYEDKSSALDENQTLAYCCYCCIAVLQGHTQKESVIHRLPIEILAVIFSLLTNKINEKFVVDTLFEKTWKINKPIEVAPDKKTIKSLIRHSLYSKPDKKQDDNINKRDNCLIC